LFVLFSQFAVGAHHSQQGGKSDPMLAWIREVTEGYENVHIEGWSSFNDGLALLALLDQYSKRFLNSPLFDFNERLDDFASEQNVSEAINLAFEVLGIPKIVEASHLLLGEEEERTIALYASMFFHEFESAQLERTQKEEMEQKIRQETSKASEKLEQLQMEKQAELTTLQNELQLMRDELTAQLKEKENTLEGIRENIHNSNTERMALTEHYNTLTKQTKEYKRTLKKLQDEYTVELEQKEVEKATKADELANLEKQANVLRDKLLEVEENSQISHDLLKTTLEEQIRDVHYWYSLQKGVPLASESLASKSEGDNELKHLEKEIIAINDRLLELLHQ